MFQKIIFLFFLSITVFAQTTVEKLCSEMQDINPDVQKHLKEVLLVISGTETGKFLLDHVSPDLKFQAKPMSILGKADSRNVITLESLRLQNSAIPEDTENLIKSKICFTAEILSHELLHNAQMRAGLFSYPAGCSGYESVLFEKLLELQAKYTGEKMFHTLCSQPEFRPFVREKPGLFLVSLRQSAEPEKMYQETLWQNLARSSEGKPLYREQLKEIRYWNLAYTEQAFRNNYGRFWNDAKGCGETAVREHLAKIIQFTNMRLTADFLLEKSANRPVQNGIAGLENGAPVLELIATPDGFLKRTFSGKNARETRFKIK